MNMETRNDGSTKLINAYFNLSLLISPGSDPEQLCQVFIPPTCQQLGFDRVWVWALPNAGAGGHFLESHLIYRTESAMEGKGGLELLKENALSEQGVQYLRPQHAAIRELIQRNPDLNLDAEKPYILLLHKEQLASLWEASWDYDPWLSRHQRMWQRLLLHFAEALIQGLKPITPDVESPSLTIASDVNSEFDPAPYTMASELAFDTFFRIGQEGNLLYANSQGRYLIDYPIEEILGIPFRNLIRKDARSRFEDYFNTQMSQAIPIISYYLPLVNRKGDIIPCEVRAEFIQIENFPQEIKLWVRNQKQSIGIDEQLRLLKKWIDQFDDAIQICDIDGNLVFYNREAGLRLGALNQEILSSKIQDLDQANPWRLYLSQIKTHKRLIVEGQNILSDNTRFPVEIHAQLMNLDGKDYIIIFSRDIRERKKTEALLLKKQNQLRSFVEAAPAAIAMFDKSLNYVAASTKWMEEYNIIDPNIVGRNYYELSPKSSKDWQEILESCLEGAIAKNEEEKVVLEDGTETWLKWEVRPWYNAEASIEGIIIFTEDITQQKRQEEQLRVAMVKAEEGGRAKQQFLANMSHEIRTPMNAILGMTRLLQKTNLSPKQAVYQEAIKASADNLLVIINDILDISKIEAGKLNIESEGFDLNRLIQSLCNSIRFRAEEKGVGLFYEVDRRIFGKVLIGDPVRLNQVLLNLVNNAIKFTNQGRVELECILVDASEEFYVIEFRVIDTGIGIDENKLNTIFESFTQGGDDVNKKFGGTGLGLSISRQLVDLFGGELKVKSKKRMGTTFYFTLKMKLGTEADLTEKKEAQKKDVNLTGVKVLLAEDHDINQFLATTLLDEWGMEVEVVENGKEAIDSLQNRNFDVVLMDIQMPIMDGLEATRIIRRRLRSEIPIIALTANAIKGDAEKYLSAGMNSYVSKPFEPIELFNTIAQVVQPDKYLVSNETASSSPQDQPEDSLGKVTRDELTYDLSHIRKMVDDDQEMIMKMTQMFLAQTPGFIHDMKSNLANKNLWEVGEIAHKLKSSINLMGIARLKNTIRIIEKYAKEDNTERHRELPGLLEELEGTFDIVFSQMREISFESLD